MEDEIGLLGVLGEMLGLLRLQVDLLHVVGSCGGRVGGVLGESLPKNTGL